MWFNLSFEILINLLTFKINILGRNIHNVGTRINTDLFRLSKITF